MKTYTVCYVYNLGAGCDYFSGLRKIVGNAFDNVDPDEYVREIRGD